MKLLIFPMYYYKSITILVFIYLPVLVLIKADILKSNFVGVYFYNSKEKGYEFSNLSRPGTTFSLYHNKINVSILDEMKNIIYNFGV